MLSEINGNIGDEFHHQKAGFHRFDFQESGTDFLPEIGRTNIHIPKHDIQREEDEARSADFGKSSNHYKAIDAFSENKSIRKRTFSSSRTVPIVSNSIERNHNFLSDDHASSLIDSITDNVQSDIVTYKPILRKKSNLKVEEKTVIKSVDETGQKRQILSDRKPDKAKRKVHHESNNAPKDLKSSLNSTEKSRFNISLSSEHSHQNTRQHGLKLTNSSVKQISHEDDRKWSQPMEIKLTRNELTGVRRSPFDGPFHFPSDFTENTILDHAKLYKGKGKVVVDFTQGEEGAKLLVYPQEMLNEAAQKKDSVYQKLIGPLQDHNSFSSKFVSHEKIHSREDIMKGKHSNSSQSDSRDMIYKVGSSKNDALKKDQLVSSETIFRPKDHSGLSDIDNPKYINKTYHAEEVAQINQEEHSHLIDEIKLTRNNEVTGSRRDILLNKTFNFPYDYRDDIILRYAKKYRGKANVVADFTNGERGAKLLVYSPGRRKDENAQKKSKVFPKAYEAGELFRRNIGKMTNNVYIQVWVYLFETTVFHFCYDVPILSVYTCATAMPNHIKVR